MDDLFSSPASATAAAAAGSLQTSTAGDLGAVGGADNSSTHRAMLGETRLAGGLASTDEAEVSVTPAAGTRADAEGGSVAKTDRFTDGSSQREAVAASVKDLATFAEGAVASRKACPRRVHEAILEAAKLASTGYFPDGDHETDHHVAQFDAYYTMFNPQTKNYSPLYAPMSRPDHLARDRNDNFDLQRRPHSPSTTSSPNSSMPVPGSTVRDSLYS